MKKQILTILLFLAISIAATAQTQCGSGVTVDNVKYQRNGQEVAITMNVDLRQTTPISDNAIIITPIITKDGQTHEFNSLAIYGRNRYYYYVRNNNGIMITGPAETSYLRKQRPDTETINSLADYEKWMDNSTLSIRTQLYGCCGNILSENITPVASLPVFLPTYIYITPEAETIKQRNIFGRAYIDFKINKIDIRENYRGNASELAKIRKDIESVKNDTDIQVKSIYIKGYASPEGRYKTNARLAKERTAAVKKYVDKLYNFPEEIVTTSYEPEDWAGYIEQIKKSTLSHKAEILKLINNDSHPEHPDQLEQTIRDQYPEDYQYILRNIYPSLRHTDYEINYIIRTFSNVEEITRLAETDPRKLSLNEFYVAALQYEQGCEEFNNIFLTAATIYPDSEVANLNAAVASLARGDYKAAAEYLRHSANSPESEYTRGLYYAINERYAEAEPHFQKAAQSGIQEATDALEQLNKFK